MKATRMIVIMSVVLGLVIGLARPGCSRLILVDGVAAAGPVSAMEYRWYAIQTTAGHENKVRGLIAAADRGGSRGRPTSG